MGQCKISCSVSLLIVTADTEHSNLFVLTLLPCRCYSVYCCPQQDILASVLLALPSQV